MCSGLLPLHTGLRPSLCTLLGPRVGRQQRPASAVYRRGQRAGSSIISNIATAPLPPPADLQRPARQQPVMHAVLIVTLATTTHLLKLGRNERNSCQVPNILTVHLQENDKPDLSQAPPFTLTDLKRAIPQHCWEKNTFKSVSYLVKDVAIVAGLAVAAYSANTW